MASPNVISFAVEQGFYDPKSGEPFNWKKAYSPTEESAASSNGARVRLWRFFDLVAPSKKFSPDTPNMELPFSVKPDKKLSVYDVMQLTRDKCEGTRFNPARGLQGGPFANPNRLPYGFKLNGQKYNTPRVIGVNRAEYVTVTQCRSWLPNPIGGLVWELRILPVLCLFISGLTGFLILLKSGITGNLTGRQPGGLLIMLIFIRR
jgi:dipeptidase